MYLCKRVAPNCRSENVRILVRILKIIRFEIGATEIRRKYLAFTVYQKSPNFRQPSDVPVSTAYNRAVRLVTSNGYEVVMEESEDRAHTTRHAALGENGKPKVIRFHVCATYGGNHGNKGENRYREMRSYLVAILT
uniref:Uncharacterized protein n=1 Tax=Sipha flava TaxID=143950 RepID=A0A2S2PUT4_9HEMI